MEYINKYYPGKVAFVKVDVDNKGDILKKFKVTHTPTFAYLGNGGSNLIYKKFAQKYTVANMV